MGYALLWLENLIAALLLAATLLACIGKIRQRWLNRPLGMVAVLLPLAAYALTVAWAGYLIEKGALIGVYYPMLVSTICYTIGGVWMLLRGLRRNTDSSASIKAGRWPGGRLAAALAFFLVLHAMTFWSLDAAVKQQLTAVRAEAGALALSVAPLRIEDRENAALVYQYAFEAVDKDDWSLAIWEQAVEAARDGLQANPTEAAFNFASTELGEFLEQHAGEMAVMRKATTLRQCHFDRDYGRPSFEMLLPEKVHMRRAAELLAVNARHQAATGDLDGAVQDINSIFAMARHAASEPLIISMLVSKSIHGTGVRTLEAVLASAPATAKELEDLDLDESVSYRRISARAFRMEEATGLSLFCATVGQFNPILAEDTELGDFFNASGLASLYRVFHLAEDLDSYRGYFRRYHMASANPYYATRHQWQDIKGMLESEGAGALTHLILPNLTDVVESVQRADALHRTALLGVATCRYQAKYGHIPAALGDLSPEFISIVPRDPFDGELMRFRLTDQQLMIYSIGSDMVDNGGNPIDRSDQTGDIRFVVALRPDIADKHSSVSGESRIDVPLITDRP